MTNRTHTSDEFGKPISATTTMGNLDGGAGNFGAPSEIRINALIEEENGRTPSSFSIATWKMIVVLVVALVLGAGGLYYVTHSGLLSNAQDAIYQHSE